MTTERVKGHSLVSEGAAHDASKRRIITGTWVTTDGPGHALCLCGTLSEHLPSRNKRRAWHRAHKDDVLREGK